MSLMTKTQPFNGATVVRDSKSGRFVTVRGAGALKGRLTIAEGIDLTKPIAAQTVKGGKRSGSVLAHGKH